MVMNTLEYKQMQMYMLNKKFQKADRMLNSIFQKVKMADPLVQVFLLKQKYQL